MFCLRPALCIHLFCGFLSMSIQLKKKIHVKWFHFFLNYMTTLERSILNVHRYSIQWSWRLYIGLVVFYKTAIKPLRTILTYAKISIYSNLGIQVRIVYRYIYPMLIARVDYVGSQDREPLTTAISTTCRCERSLPQVSLSIVFNGVYISW